MRTNIFCQSVLIIVFFVCIVLVVGCDRQSFDKKRVNVVFRLDDYSALSSTDIELKIIDDFRKNKASITFGVVPFICAHSTYDRSPQDIVPLTRTKGDIIKSGFKNGTLDIALHGYCHQTVNAKYQTEFSGVDYNSQVERLAKGKKFLEDIIDGPVTTFIPSWNEYDLNTLRAMKYLGFSTLSASKSGEAPRNSILNFLPETCDLLRIQEAVKRARSYSDTQPLIVVLFHGFDFKEFDTIRGKITYREFLDILHWLKSQDDVRLLSISQAIKVIDDLSADRFVSNKRFDSLSKLLPPIFRGRYGYLYLESTKLLKIFLCLRIGIFYLTIVTLGGVFASFVMRRLVFQKSIFVMIIGMWVSVAILFIIRIYAFHELNAGLEDIMGCAGAVVASIGVCMVSYISKKGF